MFLELVPAVWVEVKRGDRPREGDDDGVIANRPGYMCLCLAGESRSGVGGVASLHQVPQSPAAMSPSLAH